MSASKLGIFSIVFTLVGCASQVDAASVSEPQIQNTCVTCGADGVGAQRYESKDNITATVDDKPADITWTQDATSYIATVACPAGHTACFAHPVTP